jgi:hypothetical protein
VRLTAGTSPAGHKDSMADHLAGLPTLPGRLISTLTAVTMIVVDVSFWSCSSGSGPEGTR